ncbi:MAG: hypothetical protein J6Y57_08720 [Lachnospiraceae bacterium]|nr:hypothetical protein [Lachnospiraceae bacterium]
MEQRVCYRCLIRETAGADYAQKIGKYLEAIAKEDKADDTLYEYRLSVCKNCDQLWDGTCAACGCYVELRAAAKKAACPYEKW